MISRANLPNEDLEFVQFHPTGMVNLQYVPLPSSFVLIALLITIKGKYSLIIALITLRHTSTTGWLLNFIDNVVNKGDR